MSFKAKIKQLAQEKGVTAQQVQQNYLIEAFLGKLAGSTYRSNFIVKGGYLIGGIIGLGQRATMDLDATIKDLELTQENLERVAKDIVTVPTEESFSFEFQGTEEIRKAADNIGYRLKLIASFEKIHEAVTIDVTSGDKITPKEVDFNFKKIFGDGKIELLSYPLETILAEKFEAIFSRGAGTTRSRDFYDVYILSKLKGEQIDYAVLRKALINTRKNRKTAFDIEEHELILEEILQSDFQRRLWSKYQRQYSYAKEIGFDEAIKAAKRLLGRALA